MRRLIIAILLGVLLYPTIAVAEVARPFLRSEIVTGLEREKLVGAVWSTVAPDGSILTDAVGFRHAPSGLPLRASDKVQVGSITKALIATGILRLVSEGRLRLDDPVAELLPAVEIDNRWAATSPLRLRHLLDHSSGLDDARLWQVFSLEVSPDVPLAEAIGAPLKLRSRPGDTFSYSNTGYTLLGMVIEQTVNERYEAYLDRTLLAPLGMHDSSFGFVTQANDPRMAWGHFEDRVPHPAVPLYARPASQLTTTARDMALFARFLLGDGTIVGKAFIEPRLMRARGQPSGTVAARAGLGVGYALGLSLQERGGAMGICHGGDTVGYRAMLCIFPDQQQAFFRSVNSDVEGADYKWIDATLVRALRIPKQAPVVAAPMPGDIADWEGIYVPSPARFETFAYLDHVLNFATLTRDGERLRLKPFQANAHTLVPVGGRLFRAKDRSAASHVLVVDRDGSRMISNEFRSLRKVDCWRIAPLWLSLAAGLLGMIYILVSGLVRAARRSLQPAHPMLAPFVAVVVLAIPIPLFFTQSFLALGDLTLASGTMAAVTALLPLAMIYGLARSLRRGVRDRVAWFEAIAMAAVLQWTVVLFGWGLLPLRLWA